MVLDSVVRRISELASLRGGVSLAPQLTEVEAALRETHARGLPLSRDVTGALQRLAVLDSAAAVPPAAGAAHPLAFVRTAPLAGTFDALGAPAWAHGMAVSSTTGPVIDEHGTRTWIDTIAPASPAVPILDGATNTPIAVVVGASFHASIVDGRTAVDFGAGSIWLAAPLLASVAPSDGFAGIAFTAATLSAPVFTLTELDGTLVLDPGASAFLTLEPVASAAPPPGAANDGSGALASLPARVAFTLAAGGVRVAELGDAALTAYGTGAILDGGPASISYDAATAEIAVTYARVASPDVFTVVSASAPIFAAAGTAPVISGSYRIPVAQTTADALAPASSGGALGLALGAGLHAAWGNLPGPVALRSALLHVQTGMLGVLGQTGEQSVSDTYALWDARRTSGPPRACEIVMDVPGNAAVRAAEGPQGEVVVTSGCTLRAHLDRPLTARGTPPPFDVLTAAYALVRTGPDTALVVEAALAPGLVVPDADVAYVLENAVLGTRGVDALFAYGKLSGMRATSGVLIAGNPLARVVPILPDPYAAEIPDTPARTGESLVAIVGWASPPAPQLAFVIARAAGAANDVPASRAFAAAGRGGGAVLFDVSGAQSRFGVVASGAGLGGAQILGRQLTVSGEQSALFTVPGIAWEPSIALDTRAFFRPVFPDDGPGEIVAVLAPTFRPLEPGALLDAFVPDYAAGADLYAELTLPEGLTATIDTRGEPGRPRRIPRPALEHAEPAFPTDGVGGGRQLSIVAGTNLFEHTSVMPGRSRAGNADYSVPNPDPDSDAVHAALDDPTHPPDPPLPPGLRPRPISTFWNENFGGDPPSEVAPFVPLSRYDLSGYGASVFSRYALPDAGQPAIAQARFDVVVGRTAYTLVQAESVILPWFIPVVNTTIFQRDANGYVTRYNSGWQAKADGLFRFPGVAPNDVERGGIVGVVNVRSIAEASAPFAITVDGATKQFSRVTFDADVVLDAADPAVLAVLGGAGASIPSRGLTGWLDYTVGDVFAAHALHEAIALLDAYGSAGGPLAAEVRAGGPDGLTVALTGVEVVATRSDTVRPGPLPRTLAVALRGTPHLPRDGAWSLATRAATATAPQALDPRTPVPLVRSVAAPTAWHLADGADVVNLGDPLRLYGFLQATGATSVFYEHPVVDPTPDAPPIAFAQTPKLADVGALLGAGGIVADVLAMLDLGAIDGLAPAGDGFALNTTIARDVHLDRTLLPLGVVTLRMTTWKDAPASHVTVELDATKTPRWKITIRDVAFNVVVAGFGDPDALVTVHGTFIAQDGAKPTFTDIHVAYGPALDLVQQVLTEVEQVVQFLPGKEKTGLDVAFSGTKLRVREHFPLPTLPLGVGYIEDFSLDLGFDVDVLDKTLSFFVGLGDETNPFHWLVSPLSGNGMLKLGANDKVGVVMQAGIGVGLGIDVLIASGSASIVIAVRLDTTRSPIVVMVLLTGQASVDVLDGLASASLTLTAGVGIAVQPGPAKLLADVPPDPIEFLKETVVTLAAEVAVGIHLSVCWLVHVDFDGSWAFSETISGKTLTSLV